MKKFLLIIMVFICVSSIAQHKEKDKELSAQAENIKKKLSLDNKTEHLVYNVLYHVKTRIADIPLGLANYEKLVSYVNDEKIGMMKALMSVSKYKEYETLFGAADKQQIATILAKNTEHVKKYGILSEKITSADIEESSFLKNGENETTEGAETDNTEIINENPDKK
jgi:predicted regulator of amino acid metabolism with ACT domain